MRSTGFDNDELRRLHDAMAGHVERGALPGLIALVARGTDPHVDAIGTGALDGGRPMSRDSIFRIASLTKPIAAVAAMMLVDDGVLRLDDAIDTFVPELANRKVLRSLDAELDDTVPARRAITVDDVLTFRFGFGNPMVAPDSYPIQRAEAVLELRGLGPPWPPTPHTPDAWIERFASLPLMYQPGERWLYDTAASVLGVLIARCAGRPLEAFLRERIFGPLGMDDTAFSVPANKLERLTTAYMPNPESGTLTMLDGVEPSWWSAPPAFPSAAGGLVSTIDDYWAFVQMLLNRGVHEGKRLVSEASVARMTSDQLTREQRESARLFVGENGSWGLGVSVPAAGSDPHAVPGGFGWDGGTGTTWRSNIDRDLTGILFTQRAMTSPEPPQIFTDFWNHASRAV